MSRPSATSAEPQSPRHRPGSGTHGHSRRRTLCAAALVVVMGLVAGLPSLWTRDLWHDEEIRLTEGARESLHSSDGFLPRVNGKLDLTAPQLPYRATALLWQAGAGVVSARLLSVLCIVGMVLVCFAATARSRGAVGGVMAPAVALTTMALFWHVRKGGPGPLWAFLLTCAMLAGYHALERKEGRRGTFWVLCYGCAALAVLAVGLSAALLPALVLGGYCLVARKQPGKSAVAHLPGLGVFVGVVALWWAVVFRTVPEHQASLRPLVQDFAGLWASVRDGGLLKAVLATPAGLLPWVVLLPAVVPQAIRKHREPGESLGLFAVIWLGVLVVPAVLGGREGAPDYVIAAVPPLAILCAGALVSDGAGEAPSKDAMRWPMRIALAIVGVFAGLVLLAGLLHLADVSYLLLGKSHVCPVTDQPYSPYSLVASLPFVAVALASIAVALRTSVGRPGRRAWLLILAIFLLGIPADLFLTPFINAFRSARPFAEKVVQHIGPEDGLYLYRKDYDGQYNLYTGRARIPVLQDERQLLERLAGPGALVIADEKYLKRIDAPFDVTGLQVVGGRVGSRYMLLLRGGSEDEAPPDSSKSD